MKCFSAVRIGLARPGNASFAVGMETDFLKPNIVWFSSIDVGNICPGQSSRNSGANHVSEMGAGAALTEMSSSARVADQRLFLAPEQDQQHAENAEQGPARRGEDRQHRRVPEKPAEMRFQRRFQLLQAAGIDELPEHAPGSEIDAVVDDRLRAVIDDQQKGRCERQKADKTQKKTDHGASDKPVSLGCNRL